MKNGTSVSLHSGSSFAAAWETVLGPWFRRASDSAWQSVAPTLVVIPSRSHAYQLKTRLLHAGTALPAIRFLTPAELREAFGKNRNLHPPLREHLRLLLAIAAEEIAAANGANEAQLLTARAVARAPDHLLRAIDQMGAAGWSFAEAGPAELRPIEQRFRAMLAPCGFELLHQLDQAALDTAARERAPLFSNVLVLGFDAAHWPLWPLLRAAVEAAAEATVVLSDPRDEARDLDEPWVGTGEQAFGASKPMWYFDSPPFPDEPIHFLVGRTTSEQARAIVAAAVKFLEAPSCHRLGIILPGPGALARSVAAELEKAAIPHNDGLAHLAPGPFEDAAWEAWIALQEMPQLSVLLRFLRAYENAGALFDDLPLAGIEDILRRAFGEVLIDDLAVLREYCARRSEAERRVAAGLAALHFLPARATLAAFLEQTREIFAQLDWHARGEEMRRLSEGWSSGVPAEFSRHIFLRWLAEITRSFYAVRDEHGAHPFSRVHLLPYAQAEGHAWSHLILAGLNEGEWPPPGDDAGFLREEDIEEFNARIKVLNKRAVGQGSQGQGHSCVRDGHTICLGPIQQRQLALRSFLNTIESVEQAVVATASLFDENAPGRIRNPSEFFTRLHFSARGKTLSRGTLEALQKETAAWLENGAFIFPEPAPSPREIRQTRTAYDARRSGEAAGEYDFALRKPPREPVALSATDLEKTLRTPALIWMKTFLGVEGGEQNGDGWSLATGQWVHRWLGRISGAPAENRFVDLPRADEIENIVRSEALQFRREIEALLAACGRPLPDWWRSGWSNALYLADCLGSKLAGARDWPRMATEWKLPSPQTITLDGEETLRVRGRVDLILARSEDELWIVDYKTGKRKSLAPAGKPELRAEKLALKLRRGDGLQLALYALALRAAGATQIGVSVLSGNLTLSEPQLVLAELESDREFWRALAQMQASGVFGMRGAIRSEWSFHGDYPLATLGIDADLLEEKWAATHPALAGEEREE